MLPRASSSFLLKIAPIEERARAGVFLRVWRADRRQLATASLSGTAQRDAGAGARSN